MADSKPHLAGVTSMNCLFLITIGLLHFIGDFRGDDDEAVVNKMSIL